MSETGLYIQRREANRVDTAMGGLFHSATVQS